jgi:hypothetical protein
MRAYMVSYFTRYSPLFLSNKSKNKSPGGFEKWTFLKMSKNENLKKVLKRGSFSRVSEHNALIFDF